MRNLLALTVLLFGASTALAWNDDRDPYDRHGDANYRYEGSSGQRYQYDLSNPSDRIRYEVDPAAQLRDEINPSPRIDLDRGLGQYGGGAEW